MRRGAYVVAILKEVSSGIVLCNAQFQLGRRPATTVITKKENLILRVFAEYLIFRDLVDGFHNRFLILRDKDDLRAVLSLV